MHLRTLTNRNGWDAEHAEEPPRMQRKNPSRSLRPISCLCFTAVHIGEPKPIQLFRGYWLIFHAIMFATGSCNLVDDVIDGRELGGLLLSDQRRPGRLR